LFSTAELEAIQNQRIFFGIGKRDIPDSVFSIYFKIKNFFTIYSYTGQEK